jgi:excisionase family DNA binding protein
MTRNNITSERESVSIAEFARAHNVCDRTVRRWADAGTIPSFRIGPKLRRIPVEALATGRVELEVGER